MVSPVASLEKCFLTGSSGMKLWGVLPCFLLNSKSTSESNELSSWRYEIPLRDQVTPVLTGLAALVEKDLSTPERTTIEGAEEEVPPLLVDIKPAKPTLPVKQELTLKLLLAKALASRICSSLTTTAEPLLVSDGRWVRPREHVVVFSLGGLDRRLAVGLHFREGPVERSVALRLHGVEVRNLGHLEPGNYRVQLSVGSPLQALEEAGPEGASSDLNEELVKVKAASANIFMLLDAATSEEHRLQQVASAHLS